MKNFEEVSATTWVETSNSFRKEFRFDNYYEVMSFVNAVAWIAHQENHHPDLSVHYNRVEVVYTTHDVGGSVTDKDRHCIARIDALMRSNY
jgi:4a-hydroxytetrahydrobiopterin dehydratase